MNAQQIQNTKQEIEDHIRCNNEYRRQQLELMQRIGTNFVPVDFSDPTTWTIANLWPELDHIGLLGGDTALGKEAFSNRCNLNLYQVFRHLIGRDELWVSVDRYGVLKPTKNVLTKEGTRKDFPEYKTTSSWLHWDLNPFHLLGELTEDGDDPEELSFKKLEDMDSNWFIVERNGSNPKGVKVQGLVAITDARVEDGGFLTVPGFSKEYTKRWAEHHLSTPVADNCNDDRTFVSVPKNDPMIAQAVPIPVRAGSLLVWDSRQPHCNYGNDSDQFRMVQYIKAFPARDQRREKYATLCEIRKQRMEIDLNSNFHPDELGEKLLGIKPWF